MSRFSQGLEALVCKNRNVYEGYREMCKGPTFRLLALFCPSNKHSQIISSMHSDVRRMLGKDYRVPTLYYRPNASIVKRARDVPGLVVGLI
jgi:hypothetical protein